MKPLLDLVQSLSRLPGIGQKSATRLALFILRDTKGLAENLANSLRQVQEKVRFCECCQDLTEQEVCSICRDPNRDRHRICVVQEPVDVMMVEKSGEYRGLYHLLHGSISPLDGVGPEEIRIKPLLDRIKKSCGEDQVTEVILATNPNPEGEATALYLKKNLSNLGVSITRIATGVPVGGTLEYSDPNTLATSFGNRREF